MRIKIYYLTFFLFFFYVFDTFGKGEGYIIKEGKRIFPIGSYYLPEEDHKLKELADAGFNLIRCHSKEDLDRIHSLGLKGWMTNVNANNYRIYKLGHVILWLAEYEVEIGSLSEATRLVNLIRERAKNSNVQSFPDGTPGANYLIEPYPEDFPNKEYARKAVRKELRLEFGMEGMRFFDLVRWGIAAETLNKYFEVEGQIMAPLNGRFFTKGQHERMPIPQMEIDITNVGGEQILTQNPGY